jgi:GDP-4-dehydro-6-deoxy-D-mannose reductase
VRTFNLIGPGQPPNLACSSFARQIALAEHQDKIGVIKTGDLSAQRDFVDIRDAVRAYELVSTHGIAGEAYNVCSGKGASIQHCLDLLLGMSIKPLRVELDTMKLQNNDIPRQTGSLKLIKKTTGWQPQISLKNSLSDLLNDWRERLLSIVD